MLHTITYVGVSKSYFLEFLPCDCHNEGQFILASFKTENMKVWLCMCKCPKTKVRRWDREEVTEYFRIQFSLIPKWINFIFICKEGR